MEPHSGTPLRADGLRPVNAPRPAAVETDAAGTPARVQVGVRAGASRRAGGWSAVAQVDERWRIVDEWWRESPLVRTYFRVALADGRALTLFRDEVGGGWFAQAYSRPGGVEVGMGAVHRRRGKRVGGR